MERVTVHLQAVGIRHFTGPNRHRDAEKWTRLEMRRRECARPKGTAGMPEERDPDTPEGVTAKEWTAYNTPSTQRVLEVLRKYKGAPVSTMQVAEAAERSESTTHRILKVCAAVGGVRKTLRRIGPRLGHMWEIAE